MDCLQETIGGNFPRGLRVVGEVSSVGFSPQGHCYFNLKDKDERKGGKDVQLGAVAFKSVYQSLPFQLKNGTKVVCVGDLEIYPGTGRCQIKTSKIEPVGVGAYELAKKQVEEKLRREGLFDPRRKRPTPKFPKRVGVVASLTGAALRDFLSVLGARSKRVDVVVAQARAQGEGADREIVAAINLLNDRRFELNLDLIVLIRGGGSVEDLWTFNSESVARAIAGSALPVVTGVGHEIDVSVCDLVADLRALTPTDAAVRLVQLDDARLASNLDNFRGKMLGALERRLDRASERLDFLARSRVFSNPWETLYEKRARRLDELEARLVASVEKKVAEVEKTCEVLKERLVGRDPRAILSRGYSVTRRVDDMKILRDPSEVREGQVIETTLAFGKIRSVVIN